MGKRSLFERLLGQRVEKSEDLLDATLKELADHRETVRQKQAEVSRRADEIREDIKRGGRPAGPRFRL